MSNQNLTFDLQRFPEFKQAYNYCAECNIVEKLADHTAFLEYVDKRARQKIGHRSDEPYKGEVYFPSLKKVVESYVERLEGGDTIEYEDANGKILTIDMRNEFRRLKEKVGDNASDYLTWTIAKLREILVLKESAILFE